MKFADMDETDRFLWYAEAVTTGVAFAVLGEDNAAAAIAFMLPGWVALACWKDLTDRGRPVPRWFRRILGVFVPVHCVIALCVAVTFSCGKA